MRPYLSPVLLIISIALSFINVKGQGNTEPIDPKRGSVDGASMSLSDIENINLTNGNVMLNFPLLSTTQSRGGMSVSKGVSYNSKLYEPIIHEALDLSNQLADQNFLAPSYWGGWQEVGSIGYSLVRTIRFPDGTPTDLCNAGANAWSKVAYAYKLHVVFPDGNKKEFRPAGHTDIHGDGFFRVDMNGTFHSSSWSTVGGSAACGQSSTPAAGNDPMVYYSADGSYLRLEVERGNGTMNPFRMYFRDGSVYDSSTGRQTDRYGNYVESVQFSHGGEVARGFQDEFGRKVFSTSGANADEKYLYQEGLGGELIRWIVRWKKIYVKGLYTTTGAGHLMQRGGTSHQVGDFEFDVIYEIEQPEQLGGQKFEFEYYGSDTPLGPSQYSDGWGEIKSVRTPQGVVAEYEYVRDTSLPQGLTYTDHILENSIKKKTLTYLIENNGTSSSVSETWTYTIHSTNATITGPDGSVTTQLHGNTKVDHDGNGLVNRIESNGSKVEKIWGFNKTPWGGINPFVKAEFASVKDSAGNYSLTSIKEYGIDKNGNTTSIKEYDYVPYANVPRTNNFPTGLPSGSIPIRTSLTTYHDPTPDSSDIVNSNANCYWNTDSIRGVLASTEVRNGSNQTVSASSTDYDDHTTTANPTVKRAWDSTKGPVSTPLTDSNSIKTLASYNAYGMPLTTTDGRGTVTQITYGNVTTPGGVVTDLYPTQTVAAYGTALARTSTAVYDFHTGVVTSATDEDNDLTAITEYDDLGRPIKTKSAYGTALEAWTVTQYDDVNRRVIVKADLETVGDGKKVAVQHFDQLGRVRLSRTLENPWEDPTNEQHGVKVQARYKAAGTCTFDNTKTCSFQITSNPYRAATSAAATNEPTMGWTMAQSRADGRYSETETFSGADVPATFGGSNMSSTGIVKSSVDANATTVEDQAGKLRRSITNALGQLVRVDEPNASNQLGTVASPNQATHYSYDTLGKLVHVEQGVQHRWFMYDSLGRMMRVKQPEQEVNTALNTSGNPGNNSWTAAFSYDNNGNVLTATDAKNVTSTNTYDTVSRVTQRSYNDSPQTPTVTFTYDDPNIDYSKGRLTKVSSSVSETRYTEFDLAGRLKEFEQYTDGNTYTSTYDYNLSGALVKETYPSGREVQNEFDANGDISRIFGKANPSATERTYANTFSYFADGRIEKLRLGNGLWESAKINSRGQVTEFMLGRGISSGDVWKNTYEYGELSGGTVDATKNSGNIARQSITFNGLANPLVQTYQYDSLYRITEAKETSNGNQVWKQNFTYDRYGNRLTHDKWLTTVQQTLTAAEHPTIDDTTNRLLSNQGYTFDKNGNMVIDADGRQFTFNGDNKQTQVKDVSNNVIGQYWYDGEGKRIKKVTNSETTVFVYSGSKLIAEYSTATRPQNPTTSWTVTDQLGSPRVIVNSLGEVISRRDFMPFGEEIDPDGTYRKSTDEYGQADSVRQKFTGYQKDEETGLDFAEARMYQNLHGRFTAIDPLLASGKSANPQTFNRYVYVTNHPLILTDSTGLQAAAPKDDLFPCTVSCNGYFDGKKVTSTTSTPMINEVVEVKGGFGEPISSVASSVSSQIYLPPIGYGIDQQAIGELKAAENMIRDGLYEVSPDYIKGQASIPGFLNVELSVTKDYRFYFGGGGGGSIGGDGPEDVGLKLGVSLSLGFFTSTMRETQRHDAMEGANVNVNVPGPYFTTLGISQSLPSDGTSIANAPTAIEVGAPSSLGVGVGGSREVLTDYRDRLRTFMGRPQVEQ